MTTEQGRVPAPSIETTTSYRPAWVTDELVAQWCEWVRLTKSSTEGFVNRTNRQLALMRKLRVR
jgi:hypothetical protein